jgi:uncharacterized protein
MKISVRVKPNAKKNQVSPQADGTYVVSVNAPAVEGKANERLVEVLAEYFKKRRREVTVVSGSTGRQKVVEID